MAELFCFRTLATWLSTYILGPIFAFLPRHWREPLFRTTPNRLARVGTISGILEAVCSLIGLLVWYSVYVTIIGNAIAHSSSDAAGMRERLGLFAYFWFWLNPITWLVAYFGFEGVVRSVAALATGEVYATLPLTLIERFIRKAKRPPQASALALVIDAIVPGDASCDMKISSCRPKNEWKYPFTIRYAGAYFQVIADINLGAGPRPYVYSLRRLPAGEIAQGLKEYDPSDVLLQPQRVARIEK